MVLQTLPTRVLSSRQIRRAGKKQRQARSHAACSTLFVSAGNFLDDTIGLPALFRALTRHGAACEAIGRFIVPASTETDPAAWLASRGCRLLDRVPFAGLSALHIDAGGMPVLLLQGQTTRPHLPDEPERSALVSLLGAALDGMPRDLVFASPGPLMDEFLTAARARHIDAVALQPEAPRRSPGVVLVPHLSGIDWECEQALRRLEAAGVRVVRRGGCSAIDVARNELLSEALHDGAEALMFIDSDIGFDPEDALRLLARPEPVVSGVYAKKGMRELASTFADGVSEILFGPDAPHLYPLKYAATGFLRIRAEVLRRMIAELSLPLCNTHWGRGVWPFFQPTIVPQGQDKLHYLGEDWAFSHRLGQLGITPLADTTIRLWHWGRHGFSWEEAGSSIDRYRSYSYRLA